MPDDGYSEKRKKTWREIDNAKEKGGSKSGGSIKPKKKSSSQAAGDAAYADYKKQLDAFFTGGKPPEGLKKELSGAPTSMSGGIFALGSAIKKAKSQKELADAAAAYKAAGYEFGDEDGELLTALLELQNEEIQIEAMRLLNSYLDKGAFVPSPSLTKVKLDLISVSAAEDETAELAEELKRRIK